MAPQLTMFQRWVKPDVYPLIGVMAVGLTFMTYNSARAFFYPDVFVSKEERSSNEGYMCEERSGKRYKHSPLREFVKTFYDVESHVSPHVPAKK